MSDIASRIKETRSQLKLTQAEFAKLMGIGIRAQQSYERGESLPDAGYILMLAKHDLDASYILFGDDSPNKLTNDEFFILSAYRNADPSKKAAIKAVAKSSPENSDDDPSPPSGVQDDNDHSITQENRERKKIKMNSEMSALVFSSALIIFTVVAINEAVYSSDIEILHISYLFLSLFMIGFVFISGVITIKKTDR